MKIAILCEESATIREAFRKIGHYAVSCDLQQTAIKGRHIKGEERRIERSKTYQGIADAMADQWGCL